MPHPELLGFPAPPAPKPVLPAPSCTCFLVPEWAQRLCSQIPKCHAEHTAEPTNEPRTPFMVLALSKPIP